MKKSVPRALTHQPYTPHPGYARLSAAVLRTGRCAQSGSVPLPQISGQPGVPEADFRAKVGGRGTRGSSSTGPLSPMITTVATALSGGGKGRALAAGLALHSRTEAREGLITTVDG